MTSLLLLSFRIDYRHYLCARFSFPSFSQSVERTSNWNMWRGKFVLLSACASRDTREEKQACVMWTIFVMLHRAFRLQNTQWEAEMCKKVVPIFVSFFSSSWQQPATHIHTLTVQTPNTNILTHFRETDFAQTCRWEKRHESKPKIINCFK